MENVNILIPKITELFRKREGLEPDAPLTTREVTLLVCALDRFEVFMQRNPIEAETRPEPKYKLVEDVSAITCDRCAFALVDCAAYDCSQSPRAYFVLDTQ